MHRFISLTLGLFIMMGGLLLVPDAQVKAQSRLPTVSDFAPVTSKCRIQKKLYAHVTSRAVDFGKTAQCELLVYSCKPKPTEYTSEVRATRQNVCGDYYAAAAELTGPMICCDKGEPDEKKVPEGKAGPKGKGAPEEDTVPEDSKDTQGGTALHADLAVKIEVPHRYRLGPTPFAVTVQNKGPGPSAHVRLTGFITLGKLNYATTSQAKCSVSGSDFNCDFGTVAANEARSVSLQAVTEEQGQALISADVAGSAPDRITENNHAEASLEVK